MSLTETYYSRKKELTDAFDTLQHKNYAGLYQRAKEGTLNHLVNATAIVSAGNPFFGFFENVVFGMDDKTSLNARLYLGGMMYAGMGSAFTGLRNRSRMHFDITDKSSKTIQIAHDAAYGALFFGLTRPLIYLASGERDVEKIAWAAATAGVLNLAYGPIVGYATDVMSDLMGRKASARTPKFFKDQSEIVKKTAAAGAAIGSLALTTAIFYLTPDGPKGR